MSGTRRKLSFLSFAPEDEENAILLDEEMNRVWNRTPTAGPSGLPIGSGDVPLLDEAAPRTSRQVGRNASPTQSTSDLSPLSHHDDKNESGSSTWALASGSPRQPPAEDKKVQFDSKGASDQSDEEYYDVSDQSRYVDCDSNSDSLDSESDGADDHLFTVMARLRRI